MDRLADAIRELDAPTRALLDLSIRRRIRDDAMAPLLRTDPFHLAWRRARALERIAAAIGDEEDFLALGEVRAALTRLPDEAWSVPAALPPPQPEPAVAQLAEPEPVAEPEPGPSVAVPITPTVALVPRARSLVVLTGETLELNLPEPVLHALARSRELADYVRSDAAAPVRRNALVAAIAALFGLLFGRRRRRR
jgi:hypothetical protein